MKLLTLAAAAGTAILAIRPAFHKQDNEKIPEGWLIWHSYTDYSAMDSTLMVRSPDGNITEITGDFRHPMNGSFGSLPNDIVFMAIDENADEWDIFRCDLMTGKIKNLTEKSGYRNEDPKFSPDGRKIVFKRGHWDHAVDDFRYDLAELDLESGEVIMLTDDAFEEAMPCYSPSDGNIYYALYKDGISSICCLDTASGASSVIYSEEGVTAYYPVTFGDDLYFTKWDSAESRNDMLIRKSGDITESMPFNRTGCNFSDACPVDSNTIIYSATENGSYDLYFWDGTASYPLEFANSTKNELGASFYSLENAKENINEMSDLLLGKASADLNYDIDDDGIIDCYDLVKARQFLICT